MFSLYDFPNIFCRSLYYKNTVYDTYNIQNMCQLAVSLVTKSFGQQ